MPDPEPASAIPFSEPEIVYPPDVTLIRRLPISTPGPADGSAYQWLMSGEAADGGPAELLDGFAARLVAAGIPIGRATLHISTLHPLLLGFNAVWRHDVGFCDELQVNAQVRRTADYRDSPLRPIIEDGEVLRLDPRDPGTQARYGLMKSLAEAGFAHYWGMPLRPASDRAGGERYSLLTLATRDPAGFGEAAERAIEALVAPLALNADLVSRARIAVNVLDAYIGRRSGSRVLAGDIRRGSGETIDAVVFVADMRDFTGLSDRLSGAAVVRLLNAYFGRVVDAVRAEGGEVLKFIGDGLLAIFPLEGRPAESAAAAALAAARAALAALDALNATADDLADGLDEGAEGEVDGIDEAWRPLGMGVALHRGPVFFGNIGAADRLDFTVIGPAVNLAARVEPLTKEVKRRILLTDAVADLLPDPGEPLGAFSFRGLPQPVRIFAAGEGAPRDAGEAAAPRGDTAVPARFPSGRGPA